MLTNHPNQSNQINQPNSYNLPGSSKSSQPNLTISDERVFSDDYLLNNINWEVHTFGYLFDVYTTFAQRLLNPNIKETNFYLALKLVAETGEFLNLYAKQKFHNEEVTTRLIDEAGDILWYWAVINRLFDCHVEDRLFDCHVEVGIKSTETNNINIVSDLTHCASAILTSLSLGIYTDFNMFLQYFMKAYIDMLYMLSIDIRDVIQYNVRKLQKRLPQGTYIETDFNTLNRDK